MIDAESYEILGKKLRDARLAMKIELEYAAASLHIRPRYLEALEDGMLEQLPGDAYVRGYFRQYARLLDLPPEEVVEAYARIGALPQRRLFYIPDSIRHEQHPSLRLVAGTMAAALLITCWWVSTSSAPVAPKQLVTPQQVASISSIRTPACLNVKDNFSNWPPCYYQELPRETVFFPAKPVRSVMELAR